MSESLLNAKELLDLLAKVSGISNDAGNPRIKHVMHRLVSALFRTIGPAR